MRQLYKLISDLNKKKEAKFMSEATENTTKFSSTSVALTDNLIDYGKQLRMNFDKNQFSSLISIYSLMTELDSNKDIEDNLVKTIKNQFQILPSFYHVQVCRLFITRFNAEIEPEITVIPLDSTSIEIEDQLMGICDDFDSYLHKIPSIFEALYLLVKSGSDERESNDLRKKVNLLLTNRNLQAKVLMDFCDKYQAKYSDKLKRGVFPGAY